MNYKTGRPGLLQAWQITAAELMFQGYSNEQIIATIWPNADTKCKKEGKRRMLRKLPENEAWMEYYRSMINHWSIQSVGPALQKLRSQLDSGKEWLANKAANDIINQSKVVMTGADDNTVVIKMEGMPELGSPDDNG